MTKPTIIAGAARTPLGSFQGSLSTVRATVLGETAVRAAVERAGAKPEEIDSVFMGCVLPAGLGQNPARQAAIGAGLPAATAACTINKVCSSGLYAVMLADLAIRSGEAGTVVAGGMESMSGAPYYLPKARAGLRMGNATLVDGMVHDGLWEIYHDMHMGRCAEMLAEREGFTREQQDAFAEQSYRRALAAQQEGAFAAQIAPVAVPQRKGEPLMVDVDEEPGRVQFEKMRTLRPSFSKEGTVTAANASSISDGAAALLCCSEDQAKKFTPLARIVAHAQHSQEPEWFTTAPIVAARRALERAGLTVGDIDLFEINEAFSVVTMAAIKELGLDPERVNIHGGAVSLGHPIGCSGARILVTLLSALQERGAKRGLAAICNGGGEATALIIERL